ncbi:MAG: hypothetical protein GY762_11065 [Proteobacteria bacterium]|nr:hypothetical protein [Pseudomonadota bacterium]
MLLSSGCLSTRNFQAPKERITNGTAYTLTKGEMQVNVGVLTTELQNFGVEAGFTYGFGKHGEVAANLGHAGLGILNVRCKYNFIDEKWWALGIQLGLIWIRPSAVWILGEPTRQRYEGLDILSFPLEISSSFPVADWVGLSLTAGYAHTEIFGTIDDQVRFFDGSMGMRQLYLEPLVMFYIAQQAAVYIGAHLQVWGAARTRVERVESEILPGFNAGARSDDWIDIPFEERSHLAVGFELRFGKTFHTRLNILYNGAFSRNGIVRVPIAPALEMYWRF